MRGYSALQRFPEYGLFNLTLFEPQGFLSRPFLLLFPTIFLSLGLQPISHRLVRTLPLTRGSRKLTQGLGDCWCSPVGVL